MPVFVFLLFPFSGHANNSIDTVLLVSKSRARFFIMLAITLNEERKRRRRGEDEDPFSRPPSPSTTGMVGFQVTVCVRLRFSRCSLRRPKNILSTPPSPTAERRRKRRKRLERRRTVFCFEMLTKKTRLQDEDDEDSSKRAFSFAVFFY